MEQQAIPTKRMRWLGRLVLVLAFLWIPAQARAQNQGLVVRDGSLGGASAGVVQPGIDAFGQQVDYLITPELGEQVGPNLFHSFEQFGIGTGEVASFTGPDPLVGPQSVENVVSRVTGGTASGVDGTLRSTIPGADVYLLNPAGVMSGPNAGLDVQGSFFLSTADELRLADGGRFAAIDPGGSVLTMASPEAFGFLRAGALGDSRPASIEIDESVLLNGRPFAGVPPRESITIVGGDLRITGALFSAAGGAIQLVSVASAGEVPLDLALGDHGAPEWTLPSELGRIRIEPSENFRTVLSVAAPGFDAGTISIRGGEIELDSTGLFADDGQLPFGAFPSGERGGVVEIQSDDRFVMSRGLLSVNGTQAGTARIRAESVELEEATLVASFIDPSGTLRPGSRAGDVVIEAVQFRGTGSEVFVSASEAGQARIRAQSVRLQDTRLLAEAFDGDPESQSALEIDAGSEGSVAFVRSDMLATTFGTAGGGDVSIRAGDLRLEMDSLLSSGSQLDPDAPASETGPGGDVSIDVGTLLVTGGSQIVSVSQGTGAAGNVIVRTTGPTIVSGTRPEPDENTGFPRPSAIGTRTEGPGRAGEIRLDVESLTLSDGAQLDTRSTGDGEGNLLAVTARDFVSIEGAPVGPNKLVTGFFSVAAGGGNAGPIQVTARRVELRDGARISAESEPGSTGLAGDITLAGLDVLVLAGDSSIATRSARTDGGNIAITAREQVVLDDSEITASVAGGEGGSIEIDPVFVILDESAILASAAQLGGLGGRIEITADFFLASPGSTVDASAPGGPEFSGTVAINAPETDIAGTLAALPAAFIDATNQLQEPCAARRSDAAVGSLVVGAREGVPPPPDAPLGAASRVEPAGAKVDPHPAYPLLSSASTMTLPSTCP